MDKTPSRYESDGPGISPAPGQFLSTQPLPAETDPFRGPRGCGQRQAHPGLILRQRFLFATAGPNGIEGHRCRPAFGCECEMERASQPDRKRRIRQILGVGLPDEKAYPARHGRAGPAADRRRQEYRRKGGIAGTIQNRLRVVQSNDVRI